MSRAEAGPTSLIIYSSALNVGGTQGGDPAPIIGSGLPGSGGASAVTLYDSGVVYWDSTQTDPANDGGGSLYMVANISSANCCQHPLVETIGFDYNGAYYNGSGTVDFTQYNEIQFDVRYDTTSTLQIDAFNSLKNWPTNLFTPATTDPNYLADNGGGTIGLEIDAMDCACGDSGFEPLGTVNIPDAASNGWVQVTMPYSSFLAPITTSSGVVIQKYIASATSVYPNQTAKFWIDNITLINTNTGPAPQIQTYPGLDIFNATTNNGYFDHNEVVANQTSGLTWVGNTPASYSFGLSQFPTNVSAAGPEAYMFLLPNAVSQDNAPDYNDPTCMMLSVQSVAGGGFATLSYKINQPNSENYTPVTFTSYSGGPNPPSGTGTNVPTTQLLGNYMLTFTGNDTGYVTTPDGTRGSFALSGNLAENYFTETGAEQYRFLMYLGGEANVASALYQPFVYTNVSVSNQFGNLTNVSDNFVFDANQGNTVPTNWSSGPTSDPSANLLVPANVPKLSWSTPAPIAAGTALGSNQLNATATVPGTFVYNPPAGTILPIGTNILSVTFNPTDSEDYVSISNTVAISVDYFTYGDLAVQRIGNGLSSLSSASAPDFIDQYTTNGSLVNTITIPFTGSNAFSVGGNVTSEGFLSLSMDGTKLVFAGYNTNSGIANVSTSQTTGTSPVLRAIGTVDYFGNFQLPVVMTNFSGSNIRSAVSDGNGNFWAASPLGLDYFEIPAGSSLLWNTNARVAEIFNGALYCSSSSAKAVDGFGSLPTSSPGLPVPVLPDPAASPYDFAISPAGTLAYYADDNPTNLGGGIVRMTYSGGIWTSNYTLATSTSPSITTGARALAVNFSGPNPVIYAITADVQSRLIKIVDAGSNSAPATLATAAANTAFRGVKFIPIPAPVFSSSTVFMRVPAGRTNVSISETVADAAPLTYQWQYNGTNLVNNSLYSGAQSNVLTLSTVLVSNSGNYSLVVTSPYGSVTNNSAVLVVSPSQPAISWSNPAPIVYGTALGSSQLNASSVAGLPGTFVYTPASGSVLRSGVNTLTAVFTPTDTTNYNSVTNTVSLVVLQATLTVTGNNASRLVGTTNPAFTGTIVGATNGDSFNAFYTTSAVATSPPGSYPIVPSLLPPSPDSTNYTVNYVNGTLNVTNYPEDYTFVTLAGSPTNSGTNDGFASAARFNQPNNIAIATNDVIYVADTDNQTIRKLTRTATNYLATVSTLAGSPGNTGTNDGAGGAARFNFPGGLAVDWATNVYVADTLNHTIRKITPAGVVTTLAGQPGVPGTNDGTGSAARFNEPEDVTVALNGVIYVADYGNNEIREMTPVGSNWVVTTLAGMAGPGGTNDGTGSVARFNSPTSIAVDAFSNLYVADRNNDTIREITPIPFAGTTNWQVSTIAGQPGVPGTNDGAGNEAQFDQPTGIAVDTNGNIYVTDSFNHTIRQLTLYLDNRISSTLGGLAGTHGANDGTGTAARFFYPNGIAVQAGQLFVADSGNDTIREGFPPSGPPTILIPPQSQFVPPLGTATFSVVASGALPLAYQWQLNGANLVDLPGQVSGSASNVLTLTGVSTLSSGTYRVIVSNSQGATNAPAVLVTAQITPTITWSNPAPIAYGTALNSNQLDASASVPGTFAYNPTNGTVLNPGTNALTVIFTPTDMVDYSSVTDTVSLVVTPTLSITVQPIATTSATSYNPTFSVTAGGSGPFSYQWKYNGTNIAAATNSTFTVSNAQPGNVGNYSVIVSNNYGLVTNSATAALTVQPALAVWTFAGLPTTLGAGDGVGTNARFYYPTQAALDASGNIYVADVDNDVIRFITPAGVVGVLAGSSGKTGTNDGLAGNALFNSPNGVALDTSGNIYVADTVNNTIRQVVPTGSNWTVTTIAGRPGISGTNDGLGSGAEFALPKGIAVDNSGNVYVADETNNTVRKLVRTGTNWTVSTLAGMPGVAGSANGAGNIARFNSPRDVATDNGGNIYVADWNNYTVRKVTPSGVVSTLAGTAGKSGSVDGVGGAALFNQPHGVFTDNATNVYVADFFNSTIRKINAAGVVTTVAGSPGNIGSVDGTGINAQMNEPCGLVCDKAGSNFFIVDTSNHTIRKAVYAYGEPFVGVEPQAITAFAGSTVPLNGTATNVAPNFYQWTFNGSNISNATAGSLSLTNVQSGNAGNYGVVASNAVGATTNPIATLQVLPDLVLTWPAPSPITYGSTLTTNQLNATASIPGTFAYTPSNGVFLSSGTNALSVLFTPTDTNNYNSVTTNVSLVVTPAPLTVQGANASRPVGGTNPVLTGTITGAVPSDGISANYITTANVNSPAGSYPITPVLNPNSRLTNYAVSVINGELTVGIQLTTVSKNDPVLVAPYYPAAAGSNLYVTGLGTGGATAVFSISAAGGAATNFYPAYNPKQIAVLGTNLFWISPNSGPYGDTQIFRSATNGGGAAAAIYSGGLSGLIVAGSGLASDGTLLYVADQTDGNVFHLNSNGTGLAQLGPSRYSGSELNTLTVSQGVVYIGDSGQGGGVPEVISIPTNGSSFATLASGAPLVDPSGIAVGTNGMIYVADPGANNTIWQMPINGSGAPTAFLTGSPFVSIQGLAYQNGVLYITDPGGDAVYAATPSPGVLVSNTPPVITWANPSPITYGTPLGSVQLNATANVPGNFDYSPPSGTVLNAGNNTITAIFTPTDTVHYTLATNTVNIQVLPAPLTVIAANTNRPVNKANPAFTGTITGLLAQDNSVSVNYTTTATLGSLTGTYPIMPSFIDPSGRLTNYVTNLINGTLSVGTVVVWSNPAPVLYGTPLGSNQLNATADVPGTFTYTPSTNTIFTVGTHVLSLTFAPTDAVDYTNVTTNVNLVVSPAPLLITAANANRGYGQTNPIFGGTIAGLQNGDNIAATFTNSATTNTVPGVYPILVYQVLDPGNRLTNYTTNLVNGALTITALPQTNYAEAYTFTTIAGYPGFGSADGEDAQFNYPTGIAMDTAGNFYVADTDNDTIRKVTPGGLASTIAGVAGNVGDSDGTNDDAQFNYPSGIAVDGFGNVYVADTYNSTIRMITPAGVVTTIAGVAGKTGAVDGNGTNALFDYPSAIAVDANGTLFVADSQNDTIRKMTLSASTWTVSTIAGRAGSSGSTDASGASARFNNPSGIAVDANDSVYVADTDNDTIRMISLIGGSWNVTTIAGSPGNPGSANGVNPRFDAPFGVSVDSRGEVYVGDMDNDTVRILVQSGGVWSASTLAGSAGVPGDLNQSGTSAQFNHPAGLVADPNFNVYVADAQNALIRKVTSAGAVSTIAGSAGGKGSTDGPGDDARFYLPIGTAVDANDNVFVADTQNNTIRRITSVGDVSTLAGLAGNSGSVDGVGSFARFDAPNGVAVDTNDNVYVADTGNSTVRMITPTQVVITLAGSAGNPGSADGVSTNALFDYPGGIAVDNNGNVYVADTGNDTIREIKPAGTTWIVTTLAGQAGVPGTSDGAGTAALFNGPASLAVDSAGNIFVADSVNSTIRKITPVGSTWVVSTVAGHAGVTGTSDGMGALAQFHFPQGIAVDAADNLYVSDTFNYTIRKIEPSATNWTTATIGSVPDGQPGSEDGTGEEARFWNPSGMAVDASGSIFVGDTKNNTIRKGVFAQYVKYTSMPYAAPASNAAIMVTLTNQDGDVMGQWKFPWELAWRSSGTAASGLTPGSYPIEFQSVPGYVILQPASPLVIPAAGGNFTVAGAYYPTYALNTNNGGSLTVDIEPSPPAGSGWFILGGTTNAPDSSVELAAGTYIIGFAKVSGYATPPNLSVQVANGPPTVVQVTYQPSQPPGNGVDLPVPVPVDQINDENNYPFGFNGQLETDVGSGSGVAVQTNVVLTAAHLVFNDQTLSYVNHATWLFQEETGVSQPSPLQARGWYLLSGYASQRNTDINGGLAPDQSSPQSRNLDVAALYFEQPVAGGGFGGYLPSDATPNEWLTSTANKLLVGYPVDGSAFGIDNIVPGTMYEAGPQRTPLTVAPDPVSGQQVYETPGILSYPGNSGGPFYVQFNGYYYPAGVYLGTLYNGVVPYASAVRAIDSNVVNLIALASALEDAGTNNQGGGAIIVIPAAIGSSSPGLLSITLSPPAAVAAGAAWKFAGQSDSYYSVAAASAQAVTAASQVQFRTVSGWNSPPNNGTINVAANNTSVINASYSLNLNWPVQSIITASTPLPSPSLTVSSPPAGTFSYGSYSPGQVLPVGNYNLTATFTPTAPSDLANYGTSTTNISVQVVATAVLTATANNVTWFEGQPFPGYSGTVTGALPGDTFTLGYSTTVSTNAGAGTYTIVPVPSGKNIANYAVNTINGTLTVVPPPQLLQNNSFQTGGFNSWTLSGNAANNAFVIPGAAYTGQPYGAELEPTGSLGYMTQVVPTTAGQFYSLSFWLQNVPTDGPNPNEFSVAWNGKTLYDHVNLGTFNWTQYDYSVQATSASTSLQFGFRNDNSEFYLSDISIIPETMLQGVSAGKTTITLTWKSIIGEIYQVQTSPGLVNGSWTAVGNAITATATTTTSSVPIGTGPPGFYRVVLLQ